MTANRKNTLQSEPVAFRPSAIAVCPRSTARWA